MSNGEALLTHLPVRNWEAGDLPRADAIQRPSYILAMLDLGSAGDVAVIGTHFHHTSGQARLEQAQHLVRRWRGQPRTVIAGDLNAPPGRPEIEVFIAAGMIDAQSARGNEQLLTFPSTAPQSRIDWIFGSPDLAFRNFAIPSTLASDHLPLAVTVQVP